MVRDKPYLHLRGGSVVKVGEMLSGIILAAGQSSRMKGKFKQLLKFGDLNFIENICLKMTKAGIRDVVVVLGANSETILKNSSLESVKTAVNENWQSGQLSSLRTAISALDKSSEAFFLNPCDCPTVQISTYLMLKDHWLKNKEMIYIPRFQGKNGHPAIFPSIFYVELLSAELPDGAKSILKKFPELVSFIDVDDVGVTIDIDTLEDFNKLTEVSYG